MSREAAARGGPGPELEARAPAPAGAPSRDSEAGDAAPGEGDVPGADADKAPDVNEVRWDQLEDRENPRCWPARRKWTVVFSVSLFTFISPIASSMIAPDLAAIAQELGIASQVERSLVLSVFVAAYALGPLLWAPLSEVYGRAVVLQAANGLFLCFNLGCGLARTEAQLLACRFVSGIGGSAPLAVSGGVVGDMFAAEERGRAISIHSLMPLIGPAVGPVVGGCIAHAASWRWVFFAATIACGLVQAVGLLLLRETYAPVLLRRRRRRLARETPGAVLFPEHDAVGPAVARALLRPFRLLATQPIVQLLCLFTAYIYGIIYLVLATYPALWSAKYGQPVGTLSINYVSLGVGFSLGAQFCAALQDRVYVRLKRRGRDEAGRPEFRVPLMVPGAVLVPVGLLVYSWTAEARTHWIGPNVGAAVFAAGSIVTFQCVNGYVVDAYTRYAASAIGAITVLRSLAGFGFPLFAPYLYESLGYGRAGSVLAACAVAVGWPSPVLLWMYGARLRARSKFSG